MNKWKTGYVVMQCLIAATAFTACTRGDTGGEQGQQQDSGVIGSGEEESTQQEGVQPDCTGLSEEECNRLREESQQQMEESQSGEAGGMQRDDSTGE